MKNLRGALVLGFFCAAAARAATHDVEAGSDWAAVISEAASDDTIRVRDTAPAPVDAGSCASGRYLAWSLGAVAGMSLVAVGAMLFVRRRAR